MVEEPSLGISCQAWTQRSAGLRDTSSATTVEKKGNRQGKERNTAKQERKTETVEDRMRNKGNERKRVYS